MRTLSLIIIIVSLCNCHNNSYKEKNSTSNQYYKYLFSLKKITSNSILDTLNKISDTVLQDASVDSGSRKGTLYVSTLNDAKYLVYEYAAGSISAIIYYKGQKRINAAEYYPNGQIICNFPVTVDGIRNGVYSCFHENGKTRSN